MFNENSIEICIISLKSKNIDTDEDDAIKY